jgi:dipeptidyl-peptidase-3
MLRALRHPNLVKNFVKFPSTINRSKHNIMVTVQEALADQRLKHYVTPKAPVVPLEVEAAFKELNDKEKKYAHYISQASWAGMRIVLAQASHEAVAIFDFLQSFFRPLVPLDQAVEPKDIATKLNTDVEKVELLLQYAAMFYGNEGMSRSQNINK